MNKETQNAAILRDLRAGKKITQGDGYVYDCTRVAARIFELRKAGHLIDSKTIVLPNGKRIAEYSLKQPVREDVIEPEYD